VSDFVIFQLKLLIDGLKDGAVFTASFVAFGIDLIFGRRDERRLFYKLLRLSERFDLWLNLHGAVEGELNTKGLKELHVSRERLRELIENEEDLPVQVGTPFRIQRNESTEKGRRIWAAVDAAADKAPQKVKDRLAALRENEDE